jgi:hypothetical protein
LPESTSLIVIPNFYALKKDGLVNASPTFANTLHRKGILRPVGPVVVMKIREDFKK